MKPVLSRASRLLLVRGLFLILAIAAIYGIWENRMFYNAMDFLALAVIDFVFAALFSYLCITLPTTIIRKRALVEYTVLAAWIYVVVANSIGTTMHAMQLGLEKVAAGAELTVPLYIFSEALYLVALPSLAFYLLLRFVKSL